MNKPRKNASLSQFLSFATTSYALDWKLRQVELDLLSDVLQQHYRSQPREIRKSPHAWVINLNVCALAFEKYATALSLEDYTKIKNELGYSPRNLVDFTVELQKRIEKTVKEYKEAGINPEWDIVVKPTLEKTKAALQSWKECSAKLKALVKPENVQPAPRTPSAE